MKAFVISEPKTTHITDIPVPSPGPEEVLLQIRTMGLCGTDLNIYRGTNPLVSYPRIPGHEIGATIREIGEEVPEQFATGMPVAVYPGTHCGECSACRQGRYNCCRNNQIFGVQREGAFTEYVVVPYNKLYPSASLSPRELALVEPLAVGVHAAGRAEVQGDEDLVVFGCGMIGLSVIAAATAEGARVIAVDIDRQKLAVAEKAGAAECVDASGTDLHDALRSLTRDEGPLVAVEAVGRPETFRQAVEEVAFAGRVVYIGYASRPVEYDTSLFVKKELDIRGSRNSMPVDFEQAIRLLEQGRIPVDAIVTKTVPFDRIGAVLADWDARPQQVTKIQVQVS